MQRADVPLVGGPLDGRDIDVEIDDGGLPPQRIPEAWLWFPFGSELLDRPFGGHL